MLAVRRLVLAMVVCSLVAVLAVLPGRAEDVRGKKYALLIGVNKYRHRDLAALRYAENDVHALASLLTPANDFVKVRVLSGALGEKNSRDMPTAANIKKALAELLENKGKRDTVLIALSGHGVVLDVDPSEGEGATRSYPFFCPLDADFLGVSYSTGKAKKLINLIDLFDDLGKCGAGTKLVLLDACRNEMKVKATARSVDPSRVVIPEGVAALFSCARGQKAWEAEQLKHGVFFHFVLEGLRGAAKNSEGAVTWDDLGTYVKRQVSREVGNIVKGGAKQNPHALGSLIGESPVLLRLSASKAKVVPPPTKVIPPAPLDPSRFVELRRLSGGSKIVNVGFSPDGRTLLSLEDGLRKKKIGQKRSDVVRWDWSAGKERSRATIENASFSGAAFSPDGKRLYTAGLASDAEINCWDTTTRKSLWAKATSNPRGLTLSRDGKKLLYVQGKRLSVREPATGQLVRRVEYKSSANSVAPSEGGQWVALGESVWKATLLRADLKPARVLDFPGGNRTSRSGAGPLVFSPDDKHVAMAGGARQGGETGADVAVWTVQTGSIYRLLRGHGRQVVALAFSPNGLFLASGGVDREVRIWSLASGKCLAVLKGHTGGIECVRFTPCGQYVVSGSTDRTIRVWGIRR